MNHPLRIASRKQSPLSASLKAIVWTLPIFSVVLFNWVFTNASFEWIGDGTPEPASYIAKSAAIVLVAAFLVGLIYETLRRKRG